MSAEKLEALEQRARDLEIFADCEQQAREWISKHGTDALVKELRQARTNRRRIKLATPNTLILLAHIDRLEEAVAKPQWPATPSAGEDA
jgi:hypothetical protein